MKRREFIKSATVGTVAAVAAPAVIAGPQKIRWRMPTSWPKAFDIIYRGAVNIAEQVKVMSDGNFEIIPYAAGELVGGLEVFDAVSQGTFPIGHTASYYYIGKSPAFSFDTTLPFGFNFRQQNAWLYSGGGIEQMRKIYNDFNIINIPAGNTGCQMGGWFRKEINTLDDLKGLKMRIPGLGGKVMNRLGVTVQVLAGGDIYPALERGVIDATEWVGPYDDEKAGFYKVAKYYYYPAWWEPAPSLSTYVNKAAWESLPVEYQQMLSIASADTNQKMVAEFDAKNPAALKSLLEKGVELRQYSDEIMRGAQKEAFALYDELAASDPAYKEIYDNWRKFKADSDKWFSSAETAYARFAFGS